MRPKHASRIVPSHHFDGHGHACLVFRDRLPTCEQALWDGHAAFMGELVEQWQLIPGGPYADARRARAIVEVPAKEVPGE